MRMEGDKPTLVDALQRLMAVQAVELRPALVEAADAILVAAGAEKVDIFLYEKASATLVAQGVSRTPLGSKQQALGLDRLPLANGGRAASVFRTGAEFATGRADADPEELPGIVRELGIRSSVYVPLEIAGARRGVVGITSTAADAFPESVLGFARAVSKWVGVIAHRAEIVERLGAEALARGQRKAAEELVTVVAHDLRNYIGPIHGRVVLIKQRAIRDGLRSYQHDAESAEKSLRRLGQLLADLLDVGRIEQGLFEVQLVPTELVTLVREVAEGIETADVPIEVLGDPEIVVEADPARLRQALENVLSNASKHSPAGAPVTVEVSACDEPDGTARACVRIADRGPGMDPDLARRVFKRFARGASSQGLGLGLYLASEIVSAHRGTLELTTAPGSGATFTMRLPAHSRR
jgi:two-component system OmpR family sensor kinase